MKRKKTNASAVLSALIGLALVLVACAAPASQAVQTQPVQPTILVTQVVTQIVATPTITPTPEPTEPGSVAVPAYTGGWDPFQVDIYYPIQGCVASRLHEGDVAFIASGSGVVGLYHTKDIGFSPTYRQLQPGELVSIVKGPWCANGSIIWKAVTADSLVGFVPEGNGSVYWMLPMPPTTEQVLSKEEMKNLLNPQDIIIQLNRNRTIPER